MAKPAKSRSPKSRIIIGVTGPIGAGKTTLAYYLRDRHLFAYVRYSQVLADWMHSDRDDKARLQELGWDVMSHGHQRELNARLIATMTSPANYAVDGLRHPLDYESLHSSFGTEFRLIYVDAPQATRWSRERIKNRFGTLAEFRRADSHPVEKRIRELRSYASFTIHNSESISEFKDETDSIVTRIAGGRL
jgi:dephospho-CoA kinase